MDDGKKYPVGFVTKRLVMPENYFGNSQTVTRTQVEELLPNEYRGFLNRILKSGTLTLDQLIKFTGLKKDALLSDKAMSGYTGYFELQSQGLRIIEGVPTNEALRILCMGNPNFAVDFALSEPLKKFSIIFLNKVIPTTKNELEELLHEKDLLPVDKKDYISATVVEEMFGHDIYVALNMIPPPKILTLSQIETLYFDKILGYIKLGKIPEHKISGIGQRYIITQHLINSISTGIGIDAHPQKIETPISIQPEQIIIQPKQTLLIQPFQNLPGLQVTYKPVEVTLTNDALKGVLSQPNNEGNVLFRYWGHKGFSREQVLDFYNAVKEVLAIKPVNLDNSKVSLEISSHGERESAIWLMGLLNSDLIYNITQQDKPAKALLKASGIQNSELYNQLKERNFSIADDLTDTTKYQSHPPLIIVRYGDIEREKIQRLVGANKHPFIDAPLVFSIADTGMRIIQSNYSEPSYFAYLLEQEKDFSKGIVISGDNAYLLQRTNGEVKSEWLAESKFRKEIDTQPSLELFVRTLKGEDTVYSTSVSYATSLINFALSDNNPKNFPNFYSNAQEALADGKGFPMLWMISGYALWADKNNLSI